MLRIAEDYDRLAEWGREKRPLIFPNARNLQLKLLTKDEAWRIAANIAKLPGLLRP